MLYEIFLDTNDVKQFGGGGGYRYYATRVFLRHRNDANKISILIDENSLLFLCAKCRHITLRKFKK